MNIELIQRIERIIETLNPKQQVIARNLQIDPKFQILEMTMYNKSELFIKDLSTNQIYLFVIFVKSRCNCD
jgi:predicted GTPase